MRYFIVLLLLCANAEATEWYVSNAGSDGSAGTSCSVPKSEGFGETSASVVAGDTVWWCAGDYGASTFAPTRNGSAGNTIKHKCTVPWTWANQWSCSFSSHAASALSYVEFWDISLVSDYYQPGHVFSSPVVLISGGSHHLKYHRLYAVGWPQICADGNTGLISPDWAGCDTGLNRYTDVIWVGVSGGGAHTIEFYKPAILNGNHSDLELRSDNDSTECEAGEVDIWIHGDPDEFGSMSSELHHNFVNRAYCRVLIEYMIFDQAGNGDGYTTQPDDSVQVTAGGNSHGADLRHMVTRYSIFHKGGSATAGSEGIGPIDVNFGDGVLNSSKDACWEHISLFDAWGNGLIVGSSAAFMANIDNVSFLNVASARTWRMQEINTALTDKASEGYFFYLRGEDRTIDVYVNGLVWDAESYGDLLFFDGRYSGAGSHKASTAAPFTQGGVTFGSTISNHTTTANYFVAPTSGTLSGYRAVAGGPLDSTAVPIATAVGAGVSSTSLVVNRPECFMGTLNGMRAGDVIDVGGVEAIVTSVALSVGSGNGTLTLAAPISWSNNDPIRLKPNGAVFDHISALAPEGEEPPPDAPDDFIGSLPLPGAVIRPRAPVLRQGGVF